MHTCRRKHGKRATPHASAWATCLLQSGLVLSQHSCGRAAQRMARLAGLAARAQVCRPKVGGCRLPQLSANPSPQSSHVLACHSARL